MTRYDLPTIDDETRPWWDAVAEGRLLVRRCAGCGRAHLYPRPFCPSCWSTDVTWEQAGGGGTLYTWSVVYANDLPPFAERVPYVAAVVELDEGPRLMTGVVDCDPDRLEVGMRVEVTFRRETDELVLPLFRPAG